MHTSNISIADEIHIPFYIANGSQEATDLIIKLLILERLKKKKTSHIWGINMKFTPKESSKTKAC